jgi:hypothetical protein
MDSTEGQLCFGYTNLRIPLKFWEILNIRDGSHPTVWDTAESIKGMDVTLIGLYHVYSRTCTARIRDTSFYIIKQKYITRNTWSIVL